MYLPDNMHTGWSHDWKSVHLNILLFFCEDGVGRMEMYLH